MNPSEFSEESSSSTHEFSEPLEKHSWFSRVFEAYMCMFLTFSFFDARNARYGNSVFFFAKFIDFFSKPKKFHSFSKGTCTILIAQTNQKYSVESRGLNMI